MRKNSTIRRLIAITLNNHRKWTPRRGFWQSGFTLIELMITIAILGIIVAVAAPAYSNHLQKGKISQALGALGNLSLQMEKNYLDFRTYAKDGQCAISSPANDNYTFTCNSNGQDFTWVATSKNNKFKFDINNKFEKSTLTYAGQSMADVKCWMVSKSGTCF